MPQNSIPINASREYQNKRNVKHSKPINGFGLLMMSQSMKSSCFVQIFINEPYPYISQMDRSIPSPT